MAYDVELASRVRDVLTGEPGVTERPMFGGLAFLINGHLAVSASSKGGLLVRVDPARTATLLDAPRVQRFEMRGRKMDGWLHVQAAAVNAEHDLERWITRAVEYTRSLPAKS